MHYKKNVSLPGPPPYSPSKPGRDARYARVRTVFIPDSRNVAVTIRQSHTIFLAIELTPYLYKKNYVLLLS